ncbi:uncharacterized protein LOC133323266 [Musca vetustissima]|uniref:uncharacterized protein LOC133323266 n=1 Tax=Musca vetustissima TaxID=27455 RepID=UPI002AB6945D|nr:uncharacterized protein LOC133323266 [Musca vetustissima]
MAASYTLFPKLSNTNYYVWKFNIELLLLVRELWDVVVAVEESQKILIKELKAAKAFWDALKKHHEKSNITNKVSLLRQMPSKRLVSGECMEDHIHEFLSIVDRLRDLSEKVEEHKAVAFLLGTLPDDYNHLISLLEMRSEEDLTLDLVKKKLLQEFKRNMAAEILLKMATKIFVLASQM